MQRKILSLLMAGAVILGLFILIHGLRQGEGEAMASSSSVSGKTIEDGVRYSATRKRSIRRAVMRSADEFMSLNGRDVRAVLNQPGLIRRDLPSVVWQYRNESCVLDIYFTTSSAKASAAPVSYYEIRARQKDVADEDVQGVCIESLVRERAGQSFVNLDAFYKAD